jgi:hypothetical protein
MLFGEGSVHHGGDVVRQGVFLSALEGQLETESGVAQACADLECLRTTLVKSLRSAWSTTPHPSLLMSPHTNHA